MDWACSMEGEPKMLKEFWFWSLNRYNIGLLKWILKIGCKAVYLSVLEGMEVYALVGTGFFIWVVWEKTFSQNDILCPSINPLKPNRERGEG
jgi:hypothetical protein